MSAPSGSPLSSFSPSLSSSSALVTSSPSSVSRAPTGAFSSRSPTRLRRISRHTAGRWYEATLIGGMRCLAARSRTSSAGGVMSCAEACSAACWACDSLPRKASHSPRPWCSARASKRSARARKTVPGSGRRTAAASPEGGSSMAWVFMLSLDGKAHAMIGAVACRMQAGHAETTLRWRSRRPCRRDAGALQGLPVDRSRIRAAPRKTIVFCPTWRGGGAAGAWPLCGAPNARGRSPGQPGGRPP